MIYRHDPHTQAEAVDASITGYHPVSVAPDSATSADAKAERRATRGRELLMAQQEFQWLKDYQVRSPAPRMDMRYHLEGAVSLLGSSIALREQWLQASRQALLDHLQQDASAGNTLTSGTVQAGSVHEGAQARTQGLAESHDRSNQTCRALHVGEGTFNALKGQQDATPDPRIGMRYLLEGAVRVLQRRADLHREWVSHARKALQAHLARLQAAG